MDKLKPCPFCGGEAKIVLCDDEGNLHDEDYALRPYSGVGFMIRHTHEENPQCPISQTMIASISHCRRCCTRKSFATDLAFPTQCLKHLVSIRMNYK